MREIGDMRYGLFLSAALYRYYLQGFLSQAVWERVDVLLVVDFSIDRMVSFYGEDMIKLF